MTRALVQDRLLLLALSLLGILNTLSAQTWEVFDMNTAGLPSNVVKAIAHDANGNTWVGTEWGLCRFDGTAWEVFQQGTSGLPENDVRALACDSLGRVWIGFLSQGLVVYDGSDWSQFTPDNSPLPSDQLRNITFDGEGYAWLATTGGMVRTDLSDWRVYVDTDESYNGLILPGTNITDIAIRNDGVACVGTLNAGFTYVTETSVIVYTHAQDGLPDNTALGVAIDSNGDRWLACPSGGLLRNFGDVQGGFWAQYITESSGIPGNALNDVVIDASDRKIIATQAGGVGILTFNDEWQNFNAQNSDLPDNDVLCLSIAGDGSIWAGTATGGAARLVEDVSVTGQARQSLMSLYPVPAADLLFVEWPSWVSDDTMIWSILDSRGVLVDQGAWFGTGRKELTVNRYPPATYVLRIVSDHFVGTSCFVVEE